MVRVKLLVVITGSLLNKAIELNDKLIKLSERIADRLGIDPITIKYEELLEDDSRLYIDDDPYIGINIKYINDYDECAKCVAHEMRHIFQIFYSQLFNDDRARRCVNNFDKMYKKRASKMYIY